MNYYALKMRVPRYYCFSSHECSAAMAVEKIQILEAVLELRDKQTALLIQPIWPIFLVYGLDWHCFLAGSSKLILRILIFSIAMVVDHLFDIAI